MTNTAPNFRKNADQLINFFGHGDYLVKYLGKCPITGTRLYDLPDFAHPEHQPYVLRAAEYDMNGPDFMYSWMAYQGDGKARAKAIEMARKTWAPISTVLMPNTAGVYQFNRKQYMAKECTHEVYTAQFVTLAVIQTVLSALGSNHAYNEVGTRLTGNSAALRQIQNSTDVFMNDIDISIWDRMNWPNYSASFRMVAESNASTYASDKRHVRATSLSDKVSVMKAAARMIKANPELAKQN